MTLRRNLPCRAWAAGAGRARRTLALLFALGAAVSCAGLAEQRQIAVIAHRGEHRTHAENTLEAVQAAIDLGADFVELDVRTSADGQLVLMHDATVDRTTDGRGRVSRMTLEELRRLDAGVRSRSGATDIRVPSFDDALALARGCIGVYVDAKAVRAEDVVAALERNEMIDHSVIYGSVALLRRIQRLRPEARIMPEAWNSLDFLVVSSWLRPPVWAFGGVRFRRATLALARRAKLEIFVDRLHGADQPAGWQLGIERGATAIQSDHPRELIEYLRARGQHTRRGACEALTAAEFAVPPE